MICIVHPNKHTNGALEDDRVNLEWADGKTFRMYLKEAGLSGLKKHCRADVLNADGCPVRIRTSYIPKDGDVIRLRRTRSIA